MTTRTALWIAAVTIVAAGAGLAVWGTTVGYQDTIAVDHAGASLDGTSFDDPSTVSNETFDCVPPLDPERLVFWPSDATPERIPCDQGRAWRRDLVHRGEALLLLMLLTTSLALVAARDTVRGRAPALVGGGS